MALDEGEPEAEEDGTGLIEGIELCVGIGLHDAIELGEPLDDVVGLTVTLALALALALADALADELGLNVCETPILAYNNNSNKLWRILFCLAPTVIHCLSFF